MRTDDRQRLGRLAGILIAGSLLVAACSDRTDGGWQFDSGGATSDTATPDTSAPDTAAADTHGEDAEPPPSPDASRVDGGELPCDPRPICDGRACRLDLEFPETARVDVELDPAVPEDGEGQLVFVPPDYETADARIDNSLPYARVDLGTDAEPATTVFASDYDVLWDAKTESIRPRRIRDDLSLRADTELTLRPEDVETATLTGKLRLRGRTLKHWDDLDEPSDAPDYAYKPVWRLLLIDQQLGHRERFTVEAGESFSIDVAPSTYDIFLDPHGKRRPIDTGRATPMTAADAHGAVEGYRQVANDRTIDGETRLDVDLQPVEIDVDLTPRNVETATHNPHWALRFIHPSGATYSQPVTADTFTTWMYPGTYEVWLQRIDHRQDLADVRRGKALPLAEDFEVTDGATLEGEAELVEWTVRAELDGKPLPERLREMGPDHLVDQEWRVVLRGEHRPETAPRRPRARAGFDRAANRHAFGDRWAFTASPEADEGTSEIAVRTPPGPYDLFVAMAVENSQGTPIEPLPAGQAQGRAGATHTASFETNTFELGLRANGETVVPADLTSRHVQMWFQPRSDATDGTDGEPLRMRQTDDHHRNPFHIVSGTYDVQAVYTTRIDRHSQRVRHVVTRPDPWEATDETLTLHHRHRRLTGRIPTSDRRRLAAQEDDWTAHWQLRFEPVDGTSPIQRTFKSMLKEQPDSATTYETPVPPGTYDVAFSPTRLAPSIHPDYDWPVARCIRIAAP